MAELKLGVRYYSDITEPGVPCTESNFKRREIVMPLPIQKTALVLVDLWNVLHIKSWIERAKRITVSRIVPVIDKARAAGLTIIHAPSPGVARKYRMSTRYASNEELFSSPKIYDWPPRDFVEREVQYEGYALPRSRTPSLAEKQRELDPPPLDLSPDIKLHSDDYMISTGNHLQRLLKHKGILHLIYAGFATNVCIVLRDYGIRAMGRRGYNIILLRDSTTGVEWPDTVDNLLATELAIREIELFNGFSASNEDFFEACKEIAEAV